MPIRLPVSGAISRFRVAAVGEAVLGRLGLHRPDEHGAVAAAANAGRFARRGADQAAGQRQRVITPDDLDRRSIVAMADVGDEARDVDVRRTRAVTGRRLTLQAEPLRAGLAPGMPFPLLAVVAQRAAQRPGGRQPLRGQLERHFVERGEMGGVTAAEGDLGHQARGAGQQGADRCRFGVVGQLPMPIERAARLAQQAHALGHHHQGATAPGRRRRTRATAARTTRRPRTGAGSRPGRRRRRAPGPGLPPRRHRPSRRAGAAGSPNGRARPGRAASHRAGASATTHRDPDAPANSRAIRHHVSGVCTSRDPSTACPSAQGPGRLSRWTSSCMRGVVTWASERRASTAFRSAAS